MQRCADISLSESVKKYRLLLKWITRQCPKIKNRNLKNTFLNAFKNCTFPR